MAGHNLNSLIEASLGNIKSMIDVNTIVGDAITTSDGSTIIPVSKVMVGFAAGGSELPKPKSLPPDAEELFAGGSGAGLSISPIAFLVVSNGNIRVLPVSANVTSLDRIIDMAPGMIDKINDMLASREKEKE